LKERLGDAVYGEGETDLETVVAEQLLQKQLTLAVAESCTGGMIASKLVEYPGISAALVEGCVTYSNEAKMHRLGVKAETLEKYGEGNGGGHCENKRRRHRLGNHGRCRPGKQRGQAGRSGLYCGCL